MSIPSNFLHPIIPQPIKTFANRACESFIASPLLSIVFRSPKVPLFTGTALLGAAAVGHMYTKWNEGTSSKMNSIRFN
jgi:hypothetical protein